MRRSSAGPVTRPRPTLERRSRTPPHATCARRPRFRDNRIGAVWHPSPHFGRRAASSHRPRSWVRIVTAINSDIDLFTSTKRRLRSLSQNRSIDARLFPALPCSSVHIAQAGLAPRMHRQGWRRMTRFRHLPWIVAPRNDEEGSTDQILERTDASFTKFLRGVGSFDDVVADDRSVGDLPLKDWSGLIEYVHSAASRMREAEVEAHEQALRVHEILEQAHSDKRAADERVRVAEERVQEASVRAAALLDAAEERLRAAEERARVAEEWLARVEAAMTSEFLERR